ncbi:MAG: TPM domain-containing protein [Endomicrobiia bacterium]
MKKVLVLILFFFLTYLCKSDIIESLSPQGWISDFANILDETTKKQIESIIVELERKTSAEVAIVTLNSLESYTIEEFAARLFEKWGVGKRKKDNGVMFVVAIEDKKVRIEVGYGLEEILPDGLCGEILDKYVIPHFKEHNYSKGLLYGTAAIANIIAKDVGVELTGEIYKDIKLEKEPSFFEKLAILFFVIFFLLTFRYPFLSFWILSQMGSFRGSFNRGGFGGSFGGFGGGISGGGGASRGW